MKNRLFILVYILILLVVTGCGGNDSYERRNEGKSREKDTAESIIKDKDREPLHGEYSISDFFSQSSQSPLVMYLVGDDSKDAIVESIYYFNGNRVYVFPQNLVQECFADITIGALLSLDDVLVVSTLENGYKEAYNRLYQTIITGREGKKYFGKDAPKFFLASPSPVDFRYFLVLYTDRTGNNTDRETLFLPKPWGIRYVREVERDCFYRVEENGTFSYYSERRWDGDIINDLAEVSEEFALTEIIKGKFYSSSYVGFKDSEGRILVSKSNSDEDYSVTLDNPNKTNAIVDPKTGHLMQIFDSILNEIDNSDHAWKTIDKKEIQFKSVVVGITQDIDRLDPHKTVAASTKEVLYNIFEGLVKPTQDGDFVPAVAESYRILDDGKTYAFTLRKNVLFHNGKGVTADDVVYSLERCAGKLDTYDPEVQVLPSLANVAEIYYVNEEGKDVVYVRLSVPNTELISAFTCSIVPKDYNNQSIAPVGTGPFKFISYTPMVSIVMGRNDNYYGEKAELEEVEFRIFMRLEDAFSKVIEGEIDILPYLTVEMLNQLPKGYKVEAGDMSLVQGMFLNNKVKPFDNPDVRKAVNYAVDKNEILNSLNGGYGSVVGSGVFSTMDAYFNRDVIDMYPHNEEKAKELLLTAGYPSGFSFTLVVPSNYTYHVQTAEIIAKQLKKVGIVMDIQLIDWSSWISDVYRNHNFEATIIGLDSQFAPSDILKYYISGTQKNFINYESSQFDALYHEANATTDIMKKKELYNRAQQCLADDAASVFIQSPSLMVAVKDEIVGYMFYPIYVQDMASIRIE